MWKKGILETADFCSHVHLLQTANKYKSIVKLKTDAKPLSVMSNTDVMHQPVKLDKCAKRRSRLVLRAVLGGLIPAGIVPTSQNTVANLDVNL